MKTRKQKERDKKHKQIIELYTKLSQEEGSRMAMWEELERRTGFSHQGIRKVLTKHGIDYTQNTNQQNGNQIER